MKHNSRSSNTKGEKKGWGGGGKAINETDNGSVQGGS